VFVDRFDRRRATAVVAQARAGDRDFLFFPEGTFRRMPGLLPFHLGAFAAAAAAGMPVVPVALRGTRALLRGSEWLPRRAPVAVTIGAAVLPASADDHWTESLRLAAAARAFLLVESGEPDLDQALPEPTAHQNSDAHRQNERTP
jgi:1-acyl-sn-glycerol-3-phosphate acyltransferase